MAVAQTLTFTKHAAKRILQRGINAAALQVRCEDAIRAGFLKPGGGERLIWFDGVKLVFDGLVLVTVTRRHGGNRGKSKIRVHRKYDRARAKREAACE